MPVTLRMYFRQDCITARLIVCLPAPVPAKPHILTVFLPACLFSYLYVCRSAGLYNIHVRCLCTCPVYLPLYNGWDNALAKTQFLRRSERRGRSCWELSEEWLSRKAIFVNHHSLSMHTIYITDTGANIIIRLSISIASICQRSVVCIDQYCVCINYGISFFYVIQVP